MKRRVWFHRGRAIAWILAGTAALLWWQDSVLFVIIASVYANVVSDWTAGEAADHRDLLKRLDHIETTCRCAHASTADDSAPARAAPPTHAQ